jgi:hypothetical protein
MESSQNCLKAGKLCRPWLLHKVHTYLESGLGLPHPLSRMRVRPPPPEPKGGHTILRVRGVPIRTTKEKAKHSVYSRRVMFLKLYALKYFYLFSRFTITSIKIILIICLLRYKTADKELCGFLTFFDANLLSLDLYPLGLQRRGFFNISNFDKCTIACITNFINDRVCSKF